MTDIDESKELIRKLEPKIGARAANLWKWWLASDTSRDANENRQILRLLADTRLGDSYSEPIRLPPPPQSSLKGRFELGDVLYPESVFAPIGLRHEDFIKHILIVGMTGAGKTNLAYNLLKQLADAKIPFLVFDWKRNYRFLRAIPSCKDLKVYRLGDDRSPFRFNPLIPPRGTHPKHWMTMLVDVIKHAFFVAHGVEYFFRKGIDHLYRQFGIYDGKTEFPTFTDLEKLLRKEFVRGREMLWMSSAKRSLASLTFSGLLGDVVNTRTQGDIASLLNNQVVFELDNLATIEKIFLIESLLLWIYHFRKSEQSRNELKHAILIEEAHHIVSGSQERAVGEETIMESIIRMIREFGESVIAIDQEPSKLSDSILANTNTKICFTLGNGKDITTMSRAMNLRNDEFRFIDKLKVGHAIVKMKDRFTEPIHVRIPLFDYERRSGEFETPVGSP